jgi:hypothetical protein
MKNALPYGVVHHGQDDEYRDVIALDKIVISK